MSSSIEKVQLMSHAAFACKYITNHITLMPNTKVRVHYERYAKLLKPSVLPVLLGYFAGTLTVRQLPSNTANLI